MNNETLNGLMEDAFSRVREIRARKGRDYTQGAEDQLANFKLVADLADVDVMTVWMVYFLKHVTSVLAHCKGHDLQSEKLSSRVDDIITYMVLLLGLEQERVESEQATAEVPLLTGELPDPYAKIEDVSEPPEPPKGLNRLKALLAQVRGE